MTILTTNLIFELDRFLDERSTPKALGGIEFSIYDEVALFSIVSNEIKGN